MGCKLLEFVHRQSDLDALQAILQSYGDISDGLTIGEFDGFCTGVILCPDPIMPSAWLPEVFGKDLGAVFDDMETMQTAMDSIMAHYNRVAQQLMPPCTDFETVYELDPNSGDTLWEPWVDGFCRAMALYPDPWDELRLKGDTSIKDDMSMLLMMQAFYIGDLDLSEHEIDTLDATAPDIIPDIVCNLNDWVKRRSQVGPLANPIPANSPTAPTGATKPGRNDTCPCGSGKKYKKCCGR